MITYAVNSTLPLTNVPSGKSIDGGVLVGVGTGGGVIGGVVTYLAVHIRSRRISIDDSLDVWAGHGIGGLTGAILTGFFAEKAINSAGANGLLFGNAHQLVVQIIAVAAVAVYAFVATWIILKVISFFSPLRVSPDDEEQGLDIATHGEVGYRY